MSTKERLIQEIEQAPDFLLEEVLNFFLFLKLRLSQRSHPKKSPTAATTDAIPTFLQKAQAISQQISDEQWATLPSDFAKNLDHYLYGAPKVES